MAPRAAGSKTAQAQAKTAKTKANSKKTAETKANSKKTAKTKANSKKTTTTRSKTAIAKKGTLHAFSALKSGKFAGASGKTQKDGKLEAALEVAVVKEAETVEAAEEAVADEGPESVSTVSLKEETLHGQEQNTSPAVKRKTRDDDDRDDEIQTKRSRFADPVLSRPAQSPLPLPLSTLVAIHSHLLTHLLLHYSTHGLQSPSILSSLLPQLSRSTRKEVSTDHLRRISTLSHGIVAVVETEQGLGAELRGEGILGRIDSLRREFAEQVRVWWEASRQDNEQASKTPEEILQRIALSTIIEPAVNAGSSLTTTATSTAGKKPGSRSLLLAKGQRRLFELKNFSVTKATAALSTSKKENIQPGVRQSSLLDRIRLKAAASIAAAPHVPSKDALQRTSALQSLENIIPVLLQLTQRAGGSGGGMTTSFPLPTIVQHVKNSFKNPIAAEEVERAVRVLSSEVAGEWCRIVEFQGQGAAGKGVTGVVFERRGRATVEGWKWHEGM